MVSPLDQEKVYGATPPETFRTILPFASSQIELVGESDTTGGFGLLAIVKLADPVHEPDPLTVTA